MQRILKGASAAGGLKLISFGVLFITGLLLGRLLGADAYGRYSFAITVIILLRLTTALGMPLMLVREVARYNSTQQWAELRGLLRFATLSNLTAGVAVIAVLSLGLILAYGWPLPQTALVILIACPLLLILPLTDNRNAILKGLERVATGHIADQFVRPVLFLVLIVGAVLWPGFSLGDTNAMYLRLIAEAGALATACWLTARFLPKNLSRTQPAYETKLWTAGFLTFMAIDATHLVYQQTDVLMLGALVEMEDVGVYRMAANLTLIILFASDFATIILFPYISSLWAQDRKDELQSVLTRMSRIALGLTVLVFAGLMIALPVVIYLLGPDFAAIGLPLAILGLGHMARALMSSAAALLLMTGGERDGAIGIAATALCNILLNAALIPYFGVVGSATATAISTAVLSLFYLIRARQRTGLDGSILGTFNRRDSETSKPIDQPPN